MTIVYSYHCEPAEEADEVALIEQLRLAALYRRALAESENRGRALWRSWSRLVTQDARAAMAAFRKDEEFSAKVKDILSEHGDNSVWRDGYLEQKSAGSVWIPGRWEPRDRHSVRIETSGAQDWRPIAQDRLVFLGVAPEVAMRMVEREDISSAQQRQDRASRTEYAERGLGWGTYQHVEEAQAASCRTTDRDKDVWVPPPIPIGCVAVHLQPARPLRSEDDLWIRIGSRLVVRRGWQRIGDRFVRREGDLDMSGRVRPARHREVALRIGTLPDRTPRWVNLLVRVDRELPEDARVSWAMVTRRRIADAHRWEVKIVFDAPSLIRPVPTLSSSPHAAGVDVGWRRMGDCVRIATWWGTDGRSGEVTISDHVLGADEKSDSLRAIRDRMRDALRAQIAEWARIRALGPEVIHPLEIQLAACEEVDLSLRLGEAYGNLILRLSRMGAALEDFRGMLPRLQGDDLSVGSALAKLSMLGLDTEVIPTLGGLLIACDQLCLMAADGPEALRASIVPSRMRFALESFSRALLGDRYDASNRASTITRTCEVLARLGASDLAGTWLAEELAHVHQWQRYGRFARLARLWSYEDRRVLGDDEIRAALAGWVKQNRHLWRWEAFSRQKRGRRVTEVIRQFAVRLSREYGRIGVERPFVSKLVRKEERCEACRELPRRCAPCGERERMRRLASTRVPHAAPAKTREELKRFAKKYGAALVEADPANTSRDCSACGNRRDDALDWSARVVRCSVCGSEEDQDITAAKNLAGIASRAQLDEAGRPVVAADERSKGKKVLAARRTRRARVVGERDNGGEQS